MADREAGLCASGDVTPVILSEKLSVANVDGKDLLGWYMYTGRLLIEPVISICIYIIVLSQH